MNKFNEATLKPEILRAIEELGFLEPTPIQKKVIPILTNEKEDVIGLAQTGTGKTAAFGLPIIDSVDSDSKDIQALILCPTRELCLQITKDFHNFAKYLEKINIVAVYGGADIDKQINAIKRGCQVVIGTPGRVLDLVKRRVLNFEYVQWLVLDEADEMLSMGFQDDLERILNKVPDTRRTLLFSATMPEEIEHISGQYMNKPIEVTVGKKNSGADGVNHIYYVVHNKHRYDALKRIADNNPNIYGIVFCRTRTETKEVAERLIADGYNADALHGDLSQAQRDHVMNRFRIKSLQMLIATDVAARGLDVSDLTHVINYGLPNDLEIYIHRSGRTGRAGKTGDCVSILGPIDTSKIRFLERKTGKRFEFLRVPEGRAVCEKQLFNLIDRIEKVEVDESQIKDFLPMIEKKLGWMDRDQLIKHVVSMEFNRFLTYYKNSVDLNPVAPQRGLQRSDSRNFESRGIEPRRRMNRGDFSRFHINLGDENDLNANRLMGFINEKMKRRDIEIGKIEILRKFSFFEVDAKFESKVLSSFAGAKYDGVEVYVELAKPKIKSDRPYNDRGRGSYNDRERGSYNDRDRGSFTDREKGSYNNSERPSYNNNDKAPYGGGSRTKRFRDR